MATPSAPRNGTASLDDELVRNDERPDPLTTANADANADSLKLSDTLRMSIRRLERAGCEQPFRNRIALIGMTELDGKRPPGQRSGAYKLLEAVYVKGRLHWEDPVKALAPIRDILFKQEAAPNADRGLYYVLARVASAGISPAAFATHVIIPRMARDHDWRRWRARHVWVLDSIADLLIELRQDAPWNADRVAGGTVLTDIALCKYVGRPLARLSGSRIESQESQIAAWANAWRSMQLKDERFMAFLRRAVLPCFYRLSGKIDPEQLAPMGASLLKLERALAPRLGALSERAYGSFLEEAAFVASLDERARLRADAGAEDAYWALVKELRSYLELLVGLARLDAGPACMAEASAISMRKDVRYLEDAAALVSILSNAEGRGLVSWHLEALARLEPEGRPAFLEETRQAGINPGYPGRRPLCASEQFFSGPEALTLAVEEGGSASFSLRLEFPATNSSASVRPAHADAIRAALKLDELQAAVEALVSGEKDPAASEAFALLGKAQKAMKDALATSRSEELSEGAPREDSARLEGEIAFLDSVFEAIADMPRQGSEKKRFALACIASALVLERGKEGKPSTEAIASILVAAAQGIYEAPGASPSAIPGGAPGSSMAERLRLEYDSRFPGTRQAAQALSALCSLEEAIERDAELDSFFSGGESAAALAYQYAEKRLVARGGARVVSAAFRRISGRPAIAAKLARWRELLAQNALGSAGAAPGKEYLYEPVLGDVFRAELAGLKERAGRALSAAPAGSRTLLASVSAERRPGLAFAAIQLDSEGRTVLLRGIDAAPSFLASLSTREQLGLYLGFRAAAEELSIRAGFPAFIPVRHPELALDEQLCAVILGYERKAGARPGPGGWASIIRPGEEASFRARAGLAGLGYLTGPG